MKLIIKKHSIIITETVILLQNPQKEILQTQVKQKKMSKNIEKMKR
jgi:hypothetical protein